MITYTWRIKSLVKADDQGDFPGLVGQVYFELAGKNSETKKSQSLHQSVRLDPPQGAKFTPFDKLSEKQVKAWLSRHPRAEEFKAIVAHALTRKHDGEAGPVNDGDLPWQRPDGGSTI